MNKPQLFTKVNQALTEIVTTVKPDHLHTIMPEYATSTSNISLRDEINILAYENICVPKVLAGESGLTTNAELTEEFLGDDYLGTYQTYAAAANAAVANYDDWQRTVHISYGDFTAESYITDITVQRMGCLIDISSITGSKLVLADEVVQGVWEITVAFAPMLREYGVFPAEVTVPADALLIDRLQGLMGRQPR